MPDQTDKLGALWQRTSAKGVVYMTGEVGGQKIVIFANGHKETDKHPDWVIYKSKPRDEQ